jgi:hypothetical protein
MKEEAAPRTPAVLTERIVAGYESILGLAMRQLDCLRRADLEALAGVVAAKGEAVACLRDAIEAEGGRPARDAATQETLARRARSALRATLDAEEATMTLICSLRGAVGDALGEVARGEVGLASYRGAMTTTRLVDQKG